MSGSEHLGEILISAAFWVCILAACTGIALGIALNLNSAQTLRFLKATNRWISVRKRLEPLAAPHDVDKAIFKRRRSSATVFIIGGIYTVVMLVFVVDFPHVVQALSADANPVIVGILIDALRWFLLLSGVLALVVGVTMLVSEKTLPALQARLEHWYTADKVSRSGGEMRMTLDNITAAYPRATGLVLLLISSYALITAIIVWVIN